MELKIEYLNVNDLKPYEKNARKHQDEDINAIVKSIETFGFSDPIGIWGKDNLIVEGHGRLAAAKKLKMDKVPVIRLDHLTDEQRRAYALAHNKTAELSTWFEDMLNSELGDILDIDMGDFGFDLSAIENIEKVDASDVVEDDIPDPEEVENKTVSGDIWFLGKHRLICGDSTKLEDVERLVDGDKIDLFITDPPYNVDYEGGTGMKIQNDSWSDEDAFRAFLRDAFTCANAVMRDGAVFYIWHADSEGYNFRGACADVDWKVRECLIWNKNSLVLGRQDYQWKHEPCLYGWKEGAAHVWNSDRKQTTVIDYDRPTKSELHPTMKPVGLFAYEIQNSTHTGDLVLDLFGGSGTSIIACEQLDRVCYTCELDPHYADVIVQRYINFVGDSDDVWLLRNGEKVKYSEMFD